MSSKIESTGSDLRQEIRGQYARDDRDVPEEGHEAYPLSVTLSGSSCCDW